MKNKTKKILAGVCLGLVGIGCLTGCNKENTNNDLQSTYNLTVINDSQYGIISPELDNETNSVTVDRGDNYTFTITPREGYEIKNLLIDGKLVDPNSVYTFNDIESDHSIGAVYDRVLKSYSVVGICFNAHYKNADDFIDDGTYTNYKNLKLRIEQIDEPRLDDLRLSEFDETEIAISKTASADYSVAVNYILLNDQNGIYNDLKFVDFYSNATEKNTKFANLWISGFVNEENRPNISSQDGYFSFESSHFCKDTHITKFESIRNEGDLYSVAVGSGDNNVVEVMTTDGKSVMLTQVSLICKANY